MIFNEEIVVEKLDKEMPDPAYALSGDAGIDCYSKESLTINPGEVTLIPLGIKMEIPSGKAALCLPKSGLSSKYGLSAVTGLIDSGYRGEIHMIAHNISSSAVNIAKHQKICQIVVIDIPQISIKFGKVNNKTERGSNGFGSTGV